MKLVGNMKAEESFYVKTEVVTEVRTSIKCESLEEDGNQFEDSLFPSEFPKNTKVEKCTYGDYDSKYRPTLNLVPFVKLERNPKIEGAVAVSGAKREIKEERTFQDFGSKCNLNVIPVIKLFRNQEIEDAVSEARRGIKQRMLVKKMKGETDLQIVPFSQVKNHCRKENNAKQATGNEEVSDYEDEPCTLSEADNDSNLNNEVKMYLLEQAVPNCTLFICQKCNQCYRGRMSLENHLCSKINFRSSQLCCQDCSVTFPTEETLRDHNCMKDRGKFICNKCHTSYRFRHNLLSHLAHCVGINKRKFKLKCDLCTERFKTKRVLFAHLKTHYDLSGRLVCLVCNSSFKNKRTFSAHCLVHTEAFRCDECGKGFSQQSHLEFHNMTHHKPFEQRPYACNQCDKSFTKRYSLKIHKVRHLPDGRTFKCPVCEKGFYDIVGLNQHKKIHSNAKPFKCHVCENRFSRGDHLKTHMRVHTGEKPYICSDCGKGFSQTSALRVHKRVHEKVRPYKCEKCGKRFKHSATLLVHARTHSNARPYECETCGKRFSQNSNYHSHVRSMHENERMECDVCGRVFSQKSNLVSHLKLLHDDKLYKCGVCMEFIQSKYHFHNHIQAHIKEEQI